MKPLLPEPLKQQAKIAFQSFPPEILQQLQAYAFFTHTAEKVFAYSDYVLAQSLQQPEILLDLLSSGDLENPASAETYLKSIQAVFKQKPDLSSLMVLLRRLRQREMIRLVWKRVTAQEDPISLAQKLSLFAQLLISELMDYWSQEHHRAYGVALNEKGDPSLLYVIALGKLGADDLNFSSDIDIFFTYFTPTDWKDTRKTWDANEYFTKWAQPIVKILTQINEQGFVFRVDLRLRPFGQSGPMVMSYTAMEQYYQEQGREWERYALIKAKILNSKGSACEKEALYHLFHRFSYRRYVDYSVLEALRQLKTLINKQVQEESAQADLKRGRGGLREIEFMVQTVQLLKGGKDRNLQVASLRMALQYMIAEHLLPEEQGLMLLKNYNFLRSVEDAVQMMADRQTQMCPDVELDQIRLAFIMGYKQWSEFLKDLSDIRAEVSVQFDRLFSRERQTQCEIAEIELQRFSRLWHSPLAATDPAEKELQSILLKFQQGYAFSRLSKEVRLRLDGLMPMVLSIVLEEKEPALVLESFLKVIAAILRRSTYLSLLIENSAVLAHLIKACGQSVWLTEQLSEHPILLDSLLDERLSLLSLDQAGLERKMAQALLAAPEDDLEMQMEILRQLKNEYSLQAAMAYLTQRFDDEQLGLCLSDTAAAFLNTVAHLAWDWVKQKYVLDEDQPEFGIVAYGKLGGRELGFQSDLDLVFLYEAKGDLQQKQVWAEYSYQWARRIAYWLELRTYSGILYKVDTELRPSGQAGLLVSDLVHFKEYQLQKAWLWEHQALLRARMIVGPISLQQAFAEIRRLALLSPHEPEVLRRDILDMRARMRAHQPMLPASKFDIKHGLGGMIDLEFMVQFCSLSTLGLDQRGLDLRSHSELLAWLGQSHTLNSEWVADLSRVYHLYRRKMNQAALQNGPSWVDDTDLQDERALVQEIWQTLFLGKID